MASLLCFAIVHSIKPAGGCRLRTARPSTNRSMSRENWMKNRRLFVLVCAAAGLAAHSSACASAFTDAFVSSGPPPRVEDCVLIQQATPARWVCDGKVYTSVQLADIRTGKKDR